VEVEPLTTYVTRHETVYAIITRYWARAPDGVRVLTRQVTVYVTPGEFAEAVSEEELPRRFARVRPPRREGEVAVGVG